MKKRIKGGVYLVIDPREDPGFLFPAIQKAIEGGVDVLQIWNYWNDGQNKVELIDQICSIAHARYIPVIINEDWKLLLSSKIDGVHFDNPPDDLDAIRRCINNTFLCGITCGNDINLIKWADEHSLDYISFCSMFPSATAESCELVKPETVTEARRITKLPIFLAGGITLDNLPELLHTGMNGVALVSAIMQSDDPELSTRKFKNLLNEKNADK